MLSINQSIRADYQTQMSWTNYGEVGFYDVISYMGGKCSETVIIMRKDLAYYLCPKEELTPAIRTFKYDYERNKYYYNPVYGNLSWYDANIMGNQDAEYFYNLLVSEKDIGYIILDPYSSVWTARELISNKYVLEVKIHDFEIYRKI
jgi:hypothetical protein